MKNRFKIASLVLLTLTLTFCSGDDDINTNNTDNRIILDNITLDIDENQEIGNVIASSKHISHQNVTYSIINQNPENMLTIDAVTGDIKVKGSFDYETSPLIKADLVAENQNTSKTSTITINLKDVDAIASILSTTKQAYLDATDGDWIQITEDEYNNLATNLNQINKLGLLDSDYDVSTNLKSGGDDFSVINLNTNAYTSKDSHIFAFKYYMVANNQANVSGFQVKNFLKPDDLKNSAFNELGTLPDHKFVKGDVYFVKKGPFLKTPTGVLGLYKPNGLDIKYVRNGSSISFSLIKDNGNSSQTGTGYNTYQGLSTLQNQW